MNYAPIVLFVYNRADHFSKTYAALANCPEAKESELFIFSDGAKHEKSREGVEEVRAFARSIENSGKFKSIKITESPQNKGLAASVIEGVTKIVEEYGKVIVIEDDCVASPHFLGYMNKCLDYYENQKSAGSIAGYVPSLEFPEGFCKDVFAANRSCSCAWATWKDRWQGVDWDLENVSDFYNSPKLIKKLNSNGSDRFLRLYRQTKGNGSSWSVRFGAHLVKNGMVTVYPRYSYITNIGCDESGVHSQTEDAEKMRVDLSNAIADPVLTEAEINNDIQKLMKKHYSYGAVSDLKRFIATAAIVLKEKIKG